MGTSDQDVPPRLLGGAGSTSAYAESVSIVRLARVYSASTERVSPATTSSATSSTTVW